MCGSSGKQTEDVRNHPQLHHPKTALWKAEVYPLRSLFFSADIQCYMCGHMRVVCKRRVCFYLYTCVQWREMLWTFRAVPSLSQ